MSRIDFVDLLRLAHQPADDAGHDDGNDTADEREV